jgi:hypothetical protein
MTRWLMGMPSGPAQDHKRAMRSPDYSFPKNKSVFIIFASRRVTSRFLLIVLRIFNASLIQAPANGVATRLQQWYNENGSILQVFYIFHFVVGEQA